MAIEIKNANADKKNQTKRTANDNNVLIYVT